MKDIQNLIKKEKPFKKKENLEIYEIEGMIFKVYKYNPFFKIFSLKGLRSYINSFILLKKGINIPQPVTYKISWNKEIFAYKKIEGEELIEKLKKINSKETFNEIIKKLKFFTKDLFKKNIYHKDYDPTNIIIDSKGELYLIDLDNISYFLTKHRKERMLKKINRILKINFNISLDFT